MIKIFDRSVFGREASRLLTTLHHGRRSVADFAIEFRTLATTCEWNEPALVACFLEGLNMDLKEEIYARGPHNWISSSNWVFAWTGASSNGGGFEVPFLDHWRP